jgi:hypothetical protein
MPDQTIGLPRRMRHDEGHVAAEGAPEAPAKVGA